MLKLILKMKLFNLAILSLGFFSIFGCQNNQASQLDEKRAEVMKIHDEAMLHHSTINKYSRILKGVFPSIDEEAELNDIKSAITELEDANNGMMEWMQQYSDPGEETSFEETMSYYSSVQKEMEDIHIQILNAIENSKPIVLKYQK